MIGLDFVFYLGLILIAKLFEMQTTSFSLLQLNKFYNLVKIERLFLLSFSDKYFTIGK
jgi:hypothetical protein